MNAGRPKIAFFDYCDVFEDFFPHYGVSQEDFATKWDRTGNHAFVRLIQEYVGDVTWYEFSLKPTIPGAIHETLGCRVRYLRSSLVHRVLWWLYYQSPQAWRWNHRLYRPYALIASLLAPLSTDLFWALKKEKPDVIMIQDYASCKFDVLLVLSRILGIPLVAYHAGSTPETIIGKFLKPFSIPQVELLIASSTPERERLIQHLNAQPGRVEVILTPIDTVTFAPSEKDSACEACGLDPSRRYLLFVGRLSDREKRVVALVRSFACLSEAHPDVDLVLIGDGPDAALLQDMAGSLAPGRILFPGWVGSPRALAAYYSAVNCLLLPSWKEGFPTVVGEAMACGTPVIASRVGGIPELVEDGVTGWLIEPGNDEELRAALRRAMEDPGGLRDLGKAARCRALERVAPDVVGSQLQAGFGRCRKADG